MRNFAAALLGTVGMFGACALLVECSQHQNKAELKSILKSGSFCTDHSQGSCADKDFIVTGPNPPSVAEVLRSDDASRFISSKACLFGGWSTAHIGDDWYQYCYLVSDPSLPTKDERMAEASVAIYEDKDQPWRSPVAQIEPPQVKVIRQLKAAVEGLKFGARQLEVEQEALSPEAGGEGP